MNPTSPSPRQNSKQPVVRSTILDSCLEASLRSKLGALSKRLVEMDNMRARDRKVFAEDVEQGISGAQKALKPVEVAVEFRLASSLLHRRSTRVQCRVIMLEVMISPRIWRNFDWLAARELRSRTR